MIQSNNTPENDQDIYIYISHRSLSEANLMIEQDANLVVCRFDISRIALHLNYSQANQVARCHNINIKWKASLLSILPLLQRHRCNETCFDNVFVFTPKLKTFKIKATQCQTNTDTESTICDINDMFPPLPPSKKDIEKIVEGFCTSTDPKLLMESGCAICGLLCKMKDLILLTEININLDPLIVSGITREERKKDTYEIREITGPVLEP